jgi:hypothetical protein
VPRISDLHAKFDAVVVGAGIAGLTAALRLQKHGIQTLVLERRAVAGGLCGTFSLDGYEFVAGCNDFGQGLARLLGELGVEIKFTMPKAQFQLAEHVIRLPPDAPTIFKMIRRIPAVISAARHLRRNSEQTIGDLVDNYLGDPLLADLACLPAAGMMRSPDDVTIRDVLESFSRKHDYGYQRTCTPVGGPGAMVDAMISRFKQLGGELRLACECLEVLSEGAFKRVRTTAGSIITRTVLSSEGRWNRYPPTTKPGIEVAFLLLAVDKSLIYPPGYHTLAWFPQSVAEQLRCLDAGRAVSEPTFHIFRSDLPERSQHYTINALIPLPRGERNPSAERRSALTTYLLQTLDSELPGFTRSLIYERFLSPVEYEDLLGLRSAPSPFVPPTYFKKPMSYDAQLDMHFIGTSVDPPGEHAGAAARSGMLAASAAILKLAN